MHQRYYPYTHTIFLGGCFLGFIALRMLLPIPTLLLLGVILTGIVFTFTKISKQFALNIARMEYRLTTNRTPPLHKIEERLYLYGVYQEIKRTAKLIDYLNHPESHYTNAIAFDKLGNKLWPIKIPFILHARIKESELALKQTLLNPKAYRSQAFSVEGYRIEEGNSLLWIHFEITYQLASVHPSLNHPQTTLSYATKMMLHIHHYLRAKEFVSKKDYSSL